MRYFVLTLALAVTLCAGRADSQTFKSLLQFSGTGGAASGLYPYQGGLTLSGTTLYGTTSQGGANGDGNVFSVGTNGSNYQILVTFTGTSGTADGSGPVAGLTLRVQHFTARRNMGAPSSMVLATSSALALTARTTETFFPSRAPAVRQSVTFQKTP